MTATVVELKTLKAGDRCTINGHVCEIDRQARRSTFVRIVEGELAGQVVQLQRTKTVKAS